MPRSKYTAEQKYDLIQQFNKSDMLYEAFAKLISVKRVHPHKPIFISEISIIAIEIFLTEKNKKSN